MRCFGALPARLTATFRCNPLFVGIQIPEVSEVEPLEARYPQFDETALGFVRACLAYEPTDRYMQAMRPP